MLRKPVKMTQRTQGGGKSPKTYAKRYEKQSGKDKNEVGGAGSVKHILVFRKFAKVRKTAPRNR